MADTALQALESFLSSRSRSEAEERLEIAATQVEFACDGVHERLRVLVNRIKVAIATTFDQDDARADVQSFIRDRLLNLLYKASLPLTAAARVKVEAARLEVALSHYLKLTAVARAGRGGLAALGEAGQALFDAELVEVEEEDMVRLTSEGWRTLSRINRQRQVVFDQWEVLVAVAARPRSRSELQATCSTGESGLSELIGHNLVANAGARAGAEVYAITVAGQSFVASGEPLLFCGPEIRAASDERDPFEEYDPGYSLAGGFGDVAALDRAAYEQPEAVERLRTALSRTQHTILGLSDDPLNDSRYFLQ